MCLYEDNFVKVDKTELVIDGYYFPAYRSKTVKTADIKQIYYKHQEGMSDCGRVKGWGMALTPVWWASDMCRSFKSENYNVVLDTGTRIKKGFSVVNINDFLSVMKQLVPDVPYINDIPHCGCG
ncbi:hypothetical protein FO519_009846, partial [Halicephalobus sp. NKZ332]